MPDKKQNPKHIQAMKDGKAPLEYLITSVDDDDAWVLKGGADKYGVRNWTIDEILASTYEGSIRRHFKAWSEGQDNDPDSGKHHFHHIRAGCAIVLDAEKKGMLIDDRDRAKSFSQEKETTAAPDREFVWTVQYSCTQKNAQGFPLTRTKSFGPFDSHREACDFVLHHKSTPGVATLRKINLV